MPCFYCGIEIQTVVPASDVVIDSLPPILSNRFLILSSAIWGLPLSSGEKPTAAPYMVHKMSFNRLLCNILFSAPRRGRRFGLRSTGYKKHRLIVCYVNIYIKKCPREY